MHLAWGNPSFGTSNEVIASSGMLLVEGDCVVMKGVRIYFLGVIVLGIENKLSTTKDLNSLVDVQNNT